MAACSGGRRWWAHHQFSPINIALMILPEKADDLMAVLESEAFSGGDHQVTSPGHDPAVSERRWNVQEISRRLTAVGRRGGHA